MNPKTEPQLCEYLDVNCYLMDYYHFRKSRASFSYETWAQAMDVTSKSYLRFAVMGKRSVSEELAQKIAKFIGFNEVEKEYFYLLVLYTQASQPETKQAYGKRLTKILRSQVAMQELEPHPNLLMQPVYLALRNILTFADAPRTTEGLSKILGLSTIEIAVMLDQLQDSGYLEFSEQGWKAVHENIKIKDSPKNEAILNYHKLTLLKAIEAQAQPSEQRHYRSLGLPLSGTEYAEYLKDLDAFAKEIYAKYGKDSISNRRLYQINFNLFPWTETVSE